MQFNFSFQTNANGTPSMSVEQMTAFETAGRIWSTYLKDDVTVNVHVGTSDELPNNVIGGALPGIQASYKLDQLAQDLAADAISQDDQTVADNLANKDNLQIWNSPVANLTTAAAKALDVLPENSGSYYSAFYSDSSTRTVSIDRNSGNLTASVQSNALDGVIFMSNLDNLERNQDDVSDNDVSWSYPSSPASSSGNRLDFLSVALHELGHILGFVSGADDSSWLLDQSTQLKSQALSQARATKVSNFSRQITQLRDNFTLDKLSSGVGAYTFEPVSDLDLSNLTTLDLDTSNSIPFDIHALEPTVTSDSGVNADLNIPHPITGNTSSSSSSFGFDSLASTLGSDSSSNAQLSTIDLASINKTEGPKGLDLDTFNLDRSNLSSTESTKGIDLNTFNLDRSNNLSVDFDLSKINYDLNLGSASSFSSPSDQKIPGFTTNSTTVHSTSFTSDSGSTVNSNSVYSTRENSMSYNVAPTPDVDASTAPIDSNLTAEEEHQEPDSGVSSDDQLAYADLNALIWQDPYVLKALGLASPEEATEALETDESSSSDWARLVERADAHKSYTFYTSEEAVLKNASLASPTPLDLFRYSADSAALGINDIFGGGTKYFSIDGGQTVLAEFATGKDDEILGGDGYQASHWKHDNGITGIMVPALALDSAHSISTLDLRAFDVLGWDLADSLLGVDGIVSTTELQETLDLSNPQTILGIWNAAASFVQDNQATLVRDRTEDVLQMIESSEIYEGKKKKKNKASKKSKWQELWQEITDIFNSEASFSTFEKDEMLSNPHTKVIVDHSKVITDKNDDDEPIGSGDTLILPRHKITDKNDDDELIGSGDTLILPRHKIIGGQSNDELTGENDRDRLIGKQGHDVLKGKDGDDVLKGGQHRDVLVGGTGDDIFVIQDKKGFDIVRDFSDGEDYLKISGEVVFENLGISKQGNHTWIEHNNDVLMVLRNVGAETITIADFV